MRLLLLSLALLAGCSHAHATTPPPAVSHVTVIGHRGADTDAPENTLASFRKAAQLGADKIELDTQPTKDGHLVVMHDATLARTTNVEKLYPHKAPWNVNDLTLAQIRKLDAGSWYGSAYAGEHVPTLNQALNTIQKLHVGLILEAKNPQLYSNEGRLISAELKSHPYWNTTNPNRLIISSASDTFLKSFHREHAYKLTYITTPTIGQLTTIHRYAFAVSVPQKAYTQKFADAAKRMHLPVQVWDITNMPKALAMHPYAVCTDYFGG